MVPWSSLSSLNDEVLDLTDFTRETIATAMFVLCKKNKTANHNSEVDKTMTSSEICSMSVYLGSVID